MWPLRQAVFCINGTLWCAGKKKEAQLASFICADLQGGEGRVSVRDHRRADTRSRRLWANRKLDFAYDILSEWFLPFNSWMIENLPTDRGVAVAEWDAAGVTGGLRRCSQGSTTELHFIMFGLELANGRKAKTLMELIFFS